MEIVYSFGESFLLNIDNQSAEKLATNPVYFKRTKHIDIRFRNNENMLADILTKDLSETKHLYFMKFI